jgi:hypothetical protein
MATRPKFFNTVSFICEFEIELKRISLIGKVIRPINKINNIKFLVLFLESTINACSLLKNLDFKISIAGAFTLLKKLI